MSSLAPVSTAFGEAVQSLQRTLVDSRGAWDDEARRAFDRRFAERIVTEGKRSLSELRSLTEEFDSAVRQLNDLR